MPDFFLNSPSFFGGSSTENFNSSCNLTVLSIDSGSGLFVESLGHTNPTENPENLSIRLPFPRFRIFHKAKN
ncbi:hypothetical protein LEP1GSC035_0579 [Leptospira noguchii str. 2007001578]|uniref:Uncharacterized protein n=1 Tax=Leptospira noguchii str. 2007001578 TaxID=1049974 RepID=A0ABN0J1U6_9LEPT|nr:hypothetical protein LEP1GSC035_0579 [Leptospira noguchii str. 2007001578]